MSDAPQKDEKPDVKITFGPCGQITFDPPVTPEVAEAIRAEIEAGIEMANATMRRRARGW